MTEPELPNAADHSLVRGDADQTTDITSIESISGRGDLVRPAEVDTPLLDDVDDTPLHDRLPGESDRERPSIINIFDALGADSCSDSPPASPRVRFRSRVRITSGFHRRRTASPSPSASPSSSISAPLRSHSDYAGSLGPLGGRTRFLAWRNNIVCGAMSVGRGRSEQREERSPLKGPFMYSPYVVGLIGDTVDEYSAAQQRLAMEVDEIFGKWPRRLFNPRWWWWQLEPVVCCYFCGEDLDLDD